MRERVQVRDVDEAMRFFEGLILGLAIGAAGWAALVWLVLRVVR